MIRAALERAIRAHVQAELDERILVLIGDATADLYCGPSCGTSEHYRGFESACRAISDALPRCDLWVSEDGCVLDREPEWFDSEGEPAEIPEAWICVDALYVKRILLGAELAGYV